MNKSFRSLSFALAGAVLAMSALQASAAEEEPAFLDWLPASISKPVSTVGFHVHSYHSSKYASSYLRASDEGRRFNNENPGVYVINEDGWALGAYHNSFSRPTFYSGRFVNVWGPLDVALGVATGYKEGLVPMVVPTIHAGPIRLWVQPALGGPNNTTMVHLSLEFKL